MRRAPAVLLPVLAAALAGCGGSSPSAPAARPAASAADAAFVRHMLPHHERAIAVGRLAAAKGSDPRVRAFGQRIVREQVPEEIRLTSWVQTLGLRRSSADARAASGYITDPSLRALQALRGRAFDRRVLLDSASSELGAASMARTELADGRYGPARKLAASISTAPGGEVRELRALASAL